MGARREVRLSEGCNGNNPGKNNGGLDQVVASEEVRSGWILEIFESRAESICW